jgi:hypothetical protein
MAKALRSENNPFHYIEESTCEDSLILKVFFKTQIIIEVNTREADSFKNALDYFYDEPILFYIKNKDIKSKQTLDNLSFKYKILDMDELKLCNKNSLVTLMVIRKLNRKYQKIIEIICNNLTDKNSILMV